MGNEQPITIPVDFPSRDEATALAQLVKRIDYGTVNRFAAPTITYNGRSEGDVMWSAVCTLQHQLAEAGFVPR
jgi:hypothetical protein